MSEKITKPKRWQFKHCKTPAERLERSRARKRKWAAANYEANYQRLVEWRAARKAYKRAQLSAFK